MQVDVLHRTFYPVGPENVHHLSAEIPRTPHHLNTGHIEDHLAFLASSFVRYLFLRSSIIILSSINYIILYYYVVKFPDNSSNINIMSQLNSHKKFNIELPVFFMVMMKLYIMCLLL